MGEYTGPAVIVIPGLLMTLWSILAVRRITAPARWTKVAGRIRAHESDAAGEPVDVISYPLPEGGSRDVRPTPHGQYLSGRPVGASVPVWRDPQDALNAVVELPRLERFAGQLLVGILGSFFFVGGLVWAGLIWALVNR